MSEMIKMKMPTRATMHRQQQPEQQPFPRPHSPEPPRKPRRRRWRNFNVDSGDEGDCGVVERSCPFRCSRAGSRPVHVGFPRAPVGCCFTGAGRRRPNEDSPAHPEPLSHPSHPPPPQPHPAFPPPPHHPFFFPPFVMPPQGMYLPPHHLMMQPPPLPMAPAASSMGAGGHPMPTSAEEVMRAHGGHMSTGREVGPPKASAGVGPRLPTIVSPRSRGKRPPPASATDGTQIAQHDISHQGKPMRSDRKAVNSTHLSCVMVCPQIRSLQQQRLRLAVVQPPPSPTPTPPTFIPFPPVAPLQRMCVPC